MIVIVMAVVMIMVVMLLVPVRMKGMVNPLGLFRAELDG
jgi:hypothetical protein